MHVVVVESPAKAKTINKYLGKDYQVFASYGHVRDLPAKDGSVRPEEDFAMTYEVDADAKKNIAAIAKATKEADHLYLASDPDREGEAIAWHVLEALKLSKAIHKNLEVHRVTFDEITQKAVKAAFDAPREIDMHLVNAQQARRALDYLVGFTLSPVLWRKLPGSKSAGRVQSVALRLICERDEEIEKFTSQEYWDIKANLAQQSGHVLSARLVEFEGEKLEKFSITTEARANSVAESLRSKQYRIAGLEEKQAKRHPAPPFTTSTLQQEASRKLGFGAKRTMQVAQKLYEDGVITYMRTDSVNLSQDAISQARGFIGKHYGDRYLPGSPRLYKSKAKNAQEAHEAVRPTDISRVPQKSGLSDEQARLYELIWKRTVASQMESALFDQLVVDILAYPLPLGEGKGEGPHPSLLPKGEGDTRLRTTGSVMKFDGFMTLYAEGRDDEEEEGENRLPTVTKDESLNAREILPEQHFTEPPPRYSEASLVKKLEELGIGRPSTYASIISVLQDRGYVTLDKKRFVAQSLGRLVNAFLVSFFEKYVEYGFTAELEDKLDDVAGGERDWKAVLAEFWRDFIAKIEDSQKLKVSDVLSALDSLLADYAFGAAKDGKDPRACPACKTGQLGIKLGRFGPYIGCSAYPECTHKAQLGEEAAPAMVDAQGNEFTLPKALGHDPVSGEPVALKKGPYGIYVQLGEGTTSKGKEGPKRASLFKHMKPEEITLELALALLSLPRELGLHPDSKKPIVVNNGRFGPYLLHDGKFTTLPAAEDPLSIGINRAVEVLANAPAKGKRAGAEPLRVLGKHPDDAADVALYKGQYGPYVKHGKVNATLPKGADIDAFTLEEAIPLLAARAEKAGFGKGKKKPAAKAAAPKTPAKSKAKVKKAS